MVRVIKIKNVANNIINDVIIGMQNNFSAVILSVQCYGTNNDCYLITYDRDKELTEKEVIDSITSVPLDE